MSKIICIKKKNNDSEIELFPGYVKLEEECVDYGENEKVCWNCTYPFDSRDLKYIPLKYSKGIFYVSGSFCSNGCCLRYLYDNYTNKELWDKYELFNFYYFKSFDHSMNTKIPPNRLLLAKFGGSMRIEDYRNNSDYNEVIYPPIVVVNNRTNPDKFSNKKETGEDLKLFRKKKLKTDTILTNLKSNKFD